MLNTLFILIGLGVDCISRYRIYNIAYGLLGRQFSYGTLAINVIGALNIILSNILCLSATRLGVIGGRLLGKQWMPSSQAFILPKPHICLILL